MAIRKTTNNTGIYRRWNLSASDPNDTKRLIAAAVRAAEAARQSWRGDLERKGRAAGDTELWKCAAMVRAAIERNDAEEAAFLAFSLRGLIEERHNRPVEPLATVGKKVRRGGEIGHAVAHGTAAVKADRKNAILKEWDHLRKKEAKDKVSTLDRLVADKMCVSERTVRRARQSR